MFQIKKGNYNSIAKLLAECFIEDQLVIMQIKRIKNPEIFLEKLFLLQLPILRKTCDLYSLDENLHSIIAGYEKKKYNPFLVIILSIMCQFRLLHYFNRSDLKLYTENCKNTYKNIDTNWHSEFIKGNYYYIKLIAIVKVYRGKGIFSKLIMPIIRYCNKKSIPIILETNTAENIPIYRHYGFELVKTITGKEADFYQYCFIKYPS